MKKLFYTLLVLMVVVLMPSCKKYPVPEEVTYSFTDVTVTSLSSSSVAISGTFEYPGQVDHLYLYINTKKSTTNAISSIPSWDGKNVADTITGLSSNTYYYLWLNFDNGFDYHDTEYYLFSTSN